MTKQHSGGSSSGLITQSSRRISALAENYFLPQPNTWTDRLKYLRTIANHTQFIDADGQASGAWTNAIPDDKTLEKLAQYVVTGHADIEIKQLAARPDLSLLMTFASLLDYPADQMNQIVGLHREQYYKTTLGFTTNPAVPDKAYLALSLHEQTASMTLPPLTEFDGGKDSEGKPLVYANAQPVALNQSKVDSLISLGRSKESEGLRYTRTDIIDTEQKLVFDEAQFASFGDVSITDEERQAQPEIGFVLSSEELHLSGGNRTIKISFSFLEKRITKLLDHSEFTDWFDIEISTTDGFIHLPVFEGIEGVELDKTAIQANDDYLTIVLSENFQPVNVFAEQNPNWPLLPCLVFKLKRNKEALYNEAHILAMESRLSSIVGCKISTNVTGLSGLIADNDDGSLDTSKPLTPFGRNPGVSSRFHVTHPELLAKRINSASLVTQWRDCPEDMQKHYQEYRDYFAANSISRTDDWPNPDISVSHSDLLVSAQTAENTFQYASDDLQNNLLTRAIPLYAETLSMGKRSSYQALPFAQQSATQWPKWFTLTLAKDDFGHNVFTKIVEFYAYKNGLLMANPPADGDIESQLVQVKEPYSPTLHDVTLTYTSECCIGLFPEQSSLDISVAQNTIDITQMAPIGHPQIDLTPVVGTTGDIKEHSLLPGLPSQGEVYIALGELSHPGQVSIYFQIGSVDQTRLDDPEINWYFYHKSDWQPFRRSRSQAEEDEGRILEDGTFDLIDSGIIRFQFPKVVNEHPLTSDGRVWIKAALDANSTVDVVKYSNLLGVYSQGIEVELVSKEHSVEHYQSPLAKESISKLVVPDTRMKEILQPFPSSDGRVPEIPFELYQRAAERLSHKNRLLTKWDIERFTLQRFPELFAVKVVGGNASLSEIQLMVVPKNYEPQILQPKVPRSLKRKIESLIQAHSAVGLNVEVVDPNYREVTIETIVKVDEQYDIQTIVAELNEKIVEYLSPWNQPLQELMVSEAIYLPELGRVLERHPGVDVVQVLRGRKQGDDQDQYHQLVPVSTEILVPSRTHKLTLSNTLNAVFEGINVWEVEFDFVVG